MLYRFSIELSDIDRSVYETLDFRVSQHPSEIETYLLTRVLAYVLNYQPGLDFSLSGLSDPEDSALVMMGEHNQTELLIEIGNPSAKKIHKATKMAKQVMIYTYKSAEVLIEDLKRNEVHHLDQVKIFSIDSKFLNELSKFLVKNNRWSVLIQQGQMDLNFSSQSFTTQIRHVQ